MSIKRDKLVKQTSKKQGWKIIEIWECEVKGKKAVRVIEKLLIKLYEKDIVE